MVDLESAPDQTVIVFIHQNINYLLKEYNRLLIKGLLNPSFNWLGNPNCLITKIPLLLN